MLTCFESNNEIEQKCCDKFNTTFLANVRNNELNFSSPASAHSFPINRRNCYLEGGFVPSYHGVKNMKHAGTVYILL